MQNIVIENVWDIEGVMNEAIQFWTVLNALPKHVDASERAKQLVCVARQSNKLIGVCTAEEKNIAHLNNKPFYNYRILIHPEHRIPGLVDRMTKEAIDFLETLFLNKRSDCIGVITLIEDKRIQKIKNKPVYSASGLTFAGYTKNGAQIRIKYFKGATI